MENTYNMENQLEIGNKASAIITQFLLSKDFTISVDNVEDDRYYQRKDIDLIWTFKQGKEKRKLMIEVKGDTYHKSGNIFVETISNMTKNTPGCFLYTESDYIFYYFIGSGELTMIPTKKFQSWFKANGHRFKKRNLRTSYGSGYYRSEGRLVSKKVLWKELSIKPVKIKVN